MWIVIQRIFQTAHMLELYWFVCEVQIKTMKNPCRGCPSDGCCFLYGLEKHHKKRFLKIKKDVTHLCPCRSCLVKIVCNTLCDNFYAYYKMVNKKMSRG